MLLAGKNAVIYGAGGSIGAAVARAFAREGATVYLTGRTASKLQTVAEAIRAGGGAAHSAQLDALDERAVNEHADAVAEQAGSLDISFNLISHGYVQGTPMAEMQLEDYLRPVTCAVQSTFLSWRAASRHMVKQGSGVILCFGGEGQPVRGQHFGALQVALHAIESMRRQLAVELGAHGVRVLTLRTGGVPESLPEGFAGREAIARSISDATLLGRAATLEDVGRVAAFVASEQARAMTAATVNLSAGALID